jgi:hypothetical protein
LFRLPLEILENEESTFDNAGFIIECLSLYRLLLLRREDGVFSHSFFVSFVEPVVWWLLCDVLLVPLFVGLICFLLSDVLLVILCLTSSLFLLSDGRLEYEIQDK